MLILDTYEHETIWGGNRLSGERGGKVGHLYSVITEDKMASKILNGPYAGTTFRDYFKNNKSDIGMSEYSEFPFTVALVDANDDLSIQVHPNDKTAQLLENKKYGKNESWYFLDAPTSGRIYNGCVCKNKEELRAKIDEMKFDGLTDTLPVQTGDYIYIEAGTLHSLTRGSLVYEIEENCNLTYRFYDFNRKDDFGNNRETHIEKAFQVINVVKKSIAKKYLGAECITERRYSTQLLSNLTEYKNTGVDLACFTLLEGSFCLDGIEVVMGMSVLVLPGEMFRCNAKKAIIARPQKVR